MSLHFPSFFIGKNSTGASETKHWQDMITKPRQAVVQWHRLKPEWWNGSATISKAKWQKKKKKKTEETTHTNHDPHHFPLYTLTSPPPFFFFFLLLQRPHRKSLTIYFVDRNGFVHDPRLKWPKEKTSIERERRGDIGQFFVLMIKWSGGFV